MLKQGTVLVTACLLCSNLAYGQKGLFEAVRAYSGPTTGCQKAGISRQLRKRSTSTYRQAAQTQLQHPDLSFILHTGPSSFIHPRLSLSPQALYPQSPFLQTPKQLTHYFLAQHNRRLLQAIPQADQWRREVIYNIPKFHQFQKLLTHSQQQDMEWLAEQITKNTNNFLIGEMHSFPQIQQQMVLLLQQLRKRFPKRQIFLFTEFLPNSQKWGKTVHDTPWKNYTPIWHAAQQQHIQVIGLDPQFVTENLQTNLWYETTTIKDSFPAQQLRQNIWESPEAIRLRNMRWLATLKRYRQHHPHALFIIYGGAAHILYTEPYSIGKALSGPDTFTAALYPAHLINEGKTTSLTSTFDQLTRGEFLDRALQFDNPQLSKLAGFDVRLRIPNPKKSSLP